MSSATETANAAPLTLSATEQSVLLAELPPFAAALGDPAMRARYGELHAATTAGVVPASLTGLLETMAELVLQTQRVRRRHGPEAERALAALFSRTPRGLAQRQAADEVNTGLGALRGQTIEEIVFAPAPGAQRLTIVTTQGQLELTIDRSGVRIDRVDLGSVR